MKMNASQECFNCPYSNDSFPTYAEPIPGGPSTAMLQEAARAHSVYIVGGTHSLPHRRWRVCRTDSCCAHTFP